MWFPIVRCNVFITKTYTAIRIMITVNELCGKHVYTCLLPCECAKYNLRDRNVRSWVN